MQKKILLLVMPWDSSVFYSRFTNRTDHEMGSKIVNYSELKANIKAN